MTFIIRDMKKNHNKRRASTFLIRDMKINTHVTILLIAALAAAGCAKQGMPSGGQKDVTPPHARRMSPPNSTLNRQSRDFFIEFDEFVVIKDAENNILISPPMTERPEIKTKGKGIKVSIKDSLQPNTTYLFQFKDAIADYTEGNLLPSLEYVFSTGDYIDSMMLAGKVVEALSMDPDKDLVKVWLLDSSRFHQAVASMSDTNFDPPQPNYTTRTNQQGLFSFNNIKPGRYHIVAVKDEDKNNAIGIAEAVAFIDTTTEASMMPPPSTPDDTTHKESTTPQKQLILRLSTPKTDKQRLTGSKFTDAGKAVITSLLPLQNPQIDAGGEEITWRLNKQCDTLTLWTLRKECDSLQLTVSDPSGIDDTLRLKWNSRRRSPKGSPPTTLTKSNIMKIGNPSLPYYDTLALLFTTPLDTTLCRLDSAATIMLLKDSSKHSCNALMDTGTMKVLLPYSFLQGEKYTVSIAAGQFTDIYGTGNDSLLSTVTVSKAEDYGNLTLSINDSRPMTESVEQKIVELIDENGKVLLTKKITDESSVMFANLKPMKYRVRIIVDSNGNGQWDGGDFASQRQPERVVYLDKTLDIRANWDFEEELIINN